MINETNRKLYQLTQKRQNAIEEKRVNFYPHIPQEIFISLEDFLFFMGSYARFPTN